MFTLRHSEPRTVLLWGNRWHFPDREASEPFSHVTEAAELLAGHFSNLPKPVRLRLVFQPGSLRSVRVLCPKGDRRVLSFALTGEFPSLGDPHYAWGHEPVLADGDAFSTILHYEAEPALIALASQLARLGLAVDSAWPLATYLHALPEEWTETGAITVVAASAGSAIAYHHPAAASRSVECWHGEPTLTKAAQWLSRLIGENPGEPVVLVTDNDEIVSQLGATLGEVERPNLEIVPVREMLGRRVVLPRYHPAQLLPREPVVSAQRMAIAASIALFLAFGCAGALFGRDWLAAQAEIEFRQARLAALRSEVAHLRSNAAEIAVLRGLVEGGAGGPPCVAFLRTLATETPSEVVLSALRIDAGGIAVEGWLAPSSPDGVFDSWKHAVAGAAGRWTFEARTGAGGSIQATGVIRP